MDLRQLREDTRPEHEATEASMPLMAADLSLATYTGVLQRLLPVIAGWERWSAQHAPGAVRPFVEARRRSHWLAQDLRCLGACVPTEAEAPPVDWIAVVGGEVTGEAGGEAEAPNAGFLGALYVVEGSTLGGRFIARHVESALGLQPGCGNAYFQGHGEGTGKLWREITALLAALPDEESPAVIAAARRTFRAFGRALTIPAQKSEGGLMLEAVEQGGTLPQRVAS